MTGIDPERLERRLRWAAEQLGLSPQATPEEVRAVWLRRLAAEDFVPSSEGRWALAALLHRQPDGGWEARADEAAVLAEEEQSRGEVEAFAAQYWDLLPDERRRRWKELRDRCAFAPALRARLRLLEAGLDCVSAVNDKEEAPRVVELAGHLRELFVLPPGSRTLARESILRRIIDESWRRACEGPPKKISRRMGAEIKRWKAAARRLRCVDPSLAALGGDLLDQVRTATPKPKVLSRKLLPVGTANTPHHSASSIILTVIVIAIALAVVGGFIENNKPSAPTPPPSVRFPNNPFDPKESKKIPPDLWKKAAEPLPLTKEVLKKFAEEERRRRLQKQPGEKNDKSGGKSP